MKKKKFNESHSFFDIEMNQQWWFAQAIVRHVQNMSFSRASHKGRSTGADRNSAEMKCIYMTETQQDHRAQLARRNK